MRSRLANAASERLASAPGDEPEMTVPDFMAVDYRAATGVPPSLDGFRAELGRQGFEHAADVYAAMQKDRPDFKLDEEVIGSWSDELLDDSHYAEAIALRKWNTQLHPDSSGAYTWLAYTYARSGQKQLAVESYKKALEKNPSNLFAQVRLKELESAK